MSTYEKYKTAYTEAEGYFRGQIQDADSKAFEYGLVVVKNSILISGGGLLAIPTISSLSMSGSTDVSAAAWAGSFFALSIVVAILGAYIIHINWTLHASVWTDRWQQRQVWIEKYYLEGAEPESIEETGTPKQDRWISVTFMIPHFLAFVYLLLLLGGYYYLFAAFVFEVGQ